MTDRVGEVIEASTTQITAQSYELHQAPSFGSFVRTADHIFGVVSDVTTASIDPGRRPIARGRHVEREEDIYRENPQLAELLRTEFTALVVGFAEEGQMRHYLPPTPPKIHRFVYRCTPEEVAGFTDSLDFLEGLVNTVMSGPSDELIAACIREADRLRGSSRDFLVAAGKELARLLPGDPGRLNGLLRRIKG